MRIVIVAAALLALTGCKSTEQRAAEADDFCRSIGARPGSDAYVQCRLAQQQRQDAERARKRAAINEGLDDVQRSVSGNRPVNCTSTRLGNTVNTNCY
ncbi:hypothetical protein MKK88_05770 [Methylobacterium sp. E-005]|uniref:hypothetical protein n=1 Tax=Methylobacterium sp. E-005 TaxID=2836549 RepID=UPI001FBA8E90|nr:hypothetical protein [Methylobacterium sp. E-005]MCJ2085502.1 hypothetical protein [Methylobacterium sp. E-005]